MLLYLLSDVHLDWVGLPRPTSSSDILILAGDIGWPLNQHARPNNLYREFLIRCRQRFERVILVAGNHEYYGHSRDLVESTLRKLAEETSVTYLQRQTIIFDGYRFVGCTLWSEIEPTVIINDLKYVMKIDDYLLAHRTDRAWLEQELAVSSLPTVVITHHLPSYDLIHPVYKDNEANSGYASKLDSLITAPVCAWLYGHTHEYVEKKINSVSCFSNPIGYPGEERKTSYQSRSIII